MQQRCAAQLQRVARSETCLGTLKELAGFTYTCEHPLRLRAPTQHKGTVRLFGLVNHTAKGAGWRSGKGIEQEDMHRRGSDDMYKQSHLTCTRRLTERPVSADFVRRTMTGTFLRLRRCQDHLRAAVHQ